VWQLPYLNFWQKIAYIYTSLDIQTVCTVSECLYKQKQKKTAPLGHWGELGLLVHGYWAARGKAN
jgi:hypothetical protein